MPRLERVEPYFSPGFTGVRRGRGFGYEHGVVVASGADRERRLVELFEHADEV